MTTAEEDAKWGELIKEGMKKALFLIPLEDGRVVIAHGVTGAFHPVTDVYGSVGAAGQAAAERLTVAAGQIIPRGLAETGVETGR